MPAGSRLPVRDRRRNQANVYHKARVPRERSGRRPGGLSEHHQHLVLGTVVGQRDDGRSRDWGAVESDPRDPAADAVRVLDRDREGRISPDRRWIAYDSNESGKAEVYARGLVPPGGKWRISSDGGGSPVWRPEGRELLSLTAD
jgi:hypothetical protein